MAAAGRQKPRVIVLERISDDGVQEVRKARKGGGPTALQRSSWRDPDDTSPTAARTARQVTGYRTFCPLRKMCNGRGSQVTEQHIYAADQLRRSADVAAIGFSAERDGMPVTSLVYGPKPGPSKAAHAQTAAWRDFRRATKIFTPDQMQMIFGIILSNWSIQHWCEAESDRTGRRLNPQVEMGKLLGILECLVGYYRTDIDQELANGKILPVS